MAKKEAVLVEDVKPQPHFQTPYAMNPRTGEYNYEPSLTIPDETMTVREIMLRHSRGLPMGSKAPIYDEENDLPDPRRMDLADIEDVRNELKDLNASLTKKERERKAKEEADAKEAERKRIKDEARAEFEAQNMQKLP